jgi:hypothetical protein
MRTHRSMARFVWNILVLRFDLVMVHLLTLAWCVAVLSEVSLARWSFGLVIHLYALGLLAFGWLLLLIVHRLVDRRWPRRWEIVHWCILPIALATTVAICRYTTLPLQTRIWLVHDQLERFIAEHPQEIDAGMRNVNLGGFVWMDVERHDGLVFFRTFGNPNGDDGGVVFSPKGPPQSSDWFPLRSIRPLNHGWYHYWR